MKQFATNFCSISSEIPENTHRAKQFAKQFNIPYCEISKCTTEWILIYTAKQLVLRHKNNKLGGPIYVDFLSSKTTYRQKYGGGKNQLIAKAVGLKSNEQLTVLDVTAGLGQDAFVLACLGCKVLMLERSPIIAALLADGLTRAQHDDDFRQNYDLRLIQIDSISYLNQLLEKKCDYPDVIYCDPMYPHRTKSALVKKELRVLREIVGDDIDAEQLLKLALQVAKKRVVVKRPKLASSINNIKPSIIFNSTNTRYDVYLVS